MKLKFGNAYKDLDENYLKNSIILEKNYESRINEIDIINNALNNPLGTKKLREITNKNDVVCTVVLRIIKKDFNQKKIKRRIENGSKLERKKFFNINGFYTRRNKVHVGLST